jgi:hypothetical protein
MKKPFRFIILAAAILFLTGCALTVKQRAAVRDFNRAATEFADITSSEFQHTRADVLRLNIYRDQLRDDALDPERMDGSFTPERVKIRLDAMAALRSYADLLQKLVAGSQQDELKSAADALVTNLRKAKAFDISDEKGGAIAQAIASVAGLWLDHKRAQAAREVVRAADPSVKKLLAVVESEFELRSQTNWLAGYRATALLLMGRASFLVNRDTNAAVTALAAPLEARAYARTVTNRLDTAARQIVEAAHALEKAQDKLMLTLESKEIGADDVTAFAAKVEDFTTLYKTLSTK